MDKQPFERIVYECINTCPFFETEQGGLMACGHPTAVYPEGVYIISQSDWGSVPEKCPLKTQPVLITLNK